MTTANPIAEMTAFSASPAAELLVLPAAMTVDQLEAALANLAASPTVEGMVVASPDALSAGSYPSLRIVDAPATSDSWTLTAADFVNAYQLAVKNEARAILILGPAFISLDSPSVRRLADAVLGKGTDLAVSRYDLAPRAGLVNSAILYPLTRALFGSRVRFPLAMDLGLSLRMAERLAGAAQRITSINQSDALVWPINEATVAGFAIDQFDVAPRIQPPHAGPDLNTILPLVTGSLFADIDAKAAFWQRSRPRLGGEDSVVASTEETATGDASAEIGSMVEAFRLAYTNLQEIWTLVLPPNSMIGLKRLAAMDAGSFRMPDGLWARIVFDFLLAYRLRTINRGHLLGALIPLYLAWVATHVNVTASGTDPERHIEAVAAEFEAEKAYLVSRWRWPDRFNP